jgi:protein ImuA
MKKTDTAARSEIIATLREQVRRVNGSQRPHGDVIVSTGCDDLDRLFPENGIRRGSLVEWHGNGRGSGAGSLALIAARQACADGGALVLIDRSGWFYPPAASALGIDLNRLVILRPSNNRDEFWAYDQSLRCEAVSAVWGYLPRLRGRSFRQLQISAEKGNSIGLLIRPQEALNQPTWSDVRLLVNPLPSSGESPQFRVEVARCRGGCAGASGEFAIDEGSGLIRGASPSHEANSVHLDSQLAHSATSRRKTGSK